MALLPLVCCVVSRCSMIAEERVISIRLHTNGTLELDQLSTGPWVVQRGSLSVVQSRWSV
jgi:hypothetical protein